MERTVFNLAAHTEAVGGHFERRKAPNGVEMDMPIWDAGCYERALELLRPWREKPDGRYYLTDAPATWLIIALIAALAPARVGYLYMKEDGTEVDMVRLARGVKPKAENYDCAFEVIEDGDRLFVNMNSDRPVIDIAANGGPHTFDIKNIPFITIPELPKDKHIFMHAKGRFCVMDVIAWNYLEGAKSFSIACHDGDYVCCYSADPAISVGDVTKRTLENPL